MANTVPLRAAQRAAADLLDLWNRYWAIAGAVAAELGLRLRLRTDLETLAAIHRQHRDGFLPILDPACSVLAPGTALWFAAADPRGEIAATCAARLFDWPHTTLADEGRALRAFYADPAPRLAGGDVFDLPADAPSAAITGCTAYFGALWVRPDHRTLGLTRVMAQLSTGYAVTHWPIATCWALVRSSQAGLAHAFGDVIVDTGGRLRLGGAAFDVCVAWQRRERVLSEFADVMLAARPPTFA